MTISNLTRKYWINILRGWAEDRLPPPQFDECNAVLNELMPVTSKHVQNKWNCGPSSELGFWSIIAQNGNVIALRVTDEKYAHLICDTHNQT